MTNNNQSEVARLRRKLDEEAESARLGLQGLASGTSKHEFLREKMDRFGAIADELRKVVGPDKAAEILSEANDRLTGPIEPKGETE